MCPSRRRVPRVLPLLLALTLGSTGLAAQTEVIRATRVLDGRGDMA